MARLTPNRVVRISAGVIFVIFGLGKFFNHATEVDAFRSYGLPWPAVFVAAIGVVEIVGGAFLLGNRLVRPTALVLAGDMGGAIVLSGLAQGELISLTLAPLLLAGMVYLLLSPPPALDGAGPLEDRGDHPARGGE